MLGRLLQLFQLQDGEFAIARNLFVHEIAYVLSLTCASNIHKDHIPNQHTLLLLSREVLMPVLQS